MGENSKNVGDNGEQIVRKFLASIGWGPLSNSFDFPCEFPALHKLKSSKGNRQNHGIDLAFSYICPIVPDCRRNILVSVKNSRSATTIPQTSQVKDDLTDLSTALKCFKRSVPRKTMLLEGGGATTAEDYGLLIKINRDDDVSKSFVDPLKFPERLEVETGDAIFLLENDRFDFIEAVISHAKKHGKNPELSFILPKTSVNVAADSRRAYSSTLPLQSLIGGLIAVRIQAETNSEALSLFLYSNEKFTIEGLRRIASLGFDLSADWVKVTIVFPDYTQLENAADVSQVLSGMVQKNFASRVTCMSLKAQLRQQ